MHLTDPIADLLTRIRNAQKARHLDVLVPYSKMKHSVADIMKKSGFVTTVEKIKKENLDALKIGLKYEATGEPFIKSLERISKPGRRIYADTDGLKSQKDTISVGIVSTSKGLMSDRDALAANIGGELLCRVS